MHSEEKLRFRRPFRGDQFSVEPRDRTYRKKATQQLRVQARYSDGSKRDVTRLADFVANEKEIYTLISVARWRRCSDHSKIEMRPREPEVLHAAERGEHGEFRSVLEKQRLFLKVFPTEKVLSSV